ncbi:Thermostable carboxypeptidase 1 [Marinobacterium lacunae]|uniref:Metal-dependent carboxypeptidase n=1 Tax=Marinobacterium lacunae TaxID=1232683 RepID=A0A081FT95_9GAMM|nr:carboxypeptidase M32 [Marinobacterium lacunae]KEA61750.1 Thermostable carboxypeptidase 1 [Marinobacterium lacunae]
MSAYHSLVNQFARLHKLSHASTFLSWDQQVMMPPGGAEGRAQALAELHQIHHELLTAEYLGDWFEGALQEGLSEDQQANLREMHRLWQQATCLQGDLVQAQSLAASRCEHAWREQRGNNDWAGFLPNFKEVVRLAREEAQARQAAAEGDFATPYDALLDLYSSGDTSASIAEVFDGLKAQLPGLIDEVIERQRRTPNVDLSGHYNIQEQQRLSHSVMEVLGFDFSKGRLDISSHPFSTGVRGDHRITTRYRESDFIEALMGTVHETGHASYEAGLPEAWAGQPAGEARSMSIHESQSLLFEKQLLLSKPFVRFLTPIIHQHFPTLKEVDHDQFWQAMSRVHRGFIRVEADEVTYPMHIVLRYEIESALINGEMEAEDIPDAWADKMQAYLGLDTHGNYKDGCLQDIHWPSGAFGYFPSYTLGALNAAQLFSAMHRDLPALDAHLREGNVSSLRQWLGSRIWSKGSFLSSKELITQATGEATNPDYFIRHIRNRYLDM